MERNNSVRSVSNIITITVKVMRGLKYISFLFQVNQVGTIFTVHWNL